MKIKYNLIAPIMILYLPILPYYKLVKIQEQILVK